MFRRSLLAVLVGVCSVAAATAGSAGAAAKPAAAAACSGTVSIGMMAPITGPAASIGSDQLHWAQYFVSEWNKKNALKLAIVQGDTQLDPAKASVVSQQFKSNSKILGVIGPAGSQEVTAAAPILKRAGLAWVSGSASAVPLTNGKLRGYFYRVVPNDGVQGPTVASYILTKLKVKSGDSVMIIDDQESYSTGLAGITGKALQSKGVTVARESVDQKATDFSSLVAKVDGSTKVVFAPFQIASQAQLLAQQLKAQGKTAVVFGSDGVFDSSKFKVDGSYISFFAPDVTTIKADAKIVAGFHKAYPGATSPFGAPNYVAAQAYAQAAMSACKKGPVTRASLRAALAKTFLPSTILGQPLTFTKNGDVKGAAFHVFKIVKGKYLTVQ